MHVEVMVASIAGIAVITSAIVSTLGALIGTRAALSTKMAVLEHRMQETEKAIIKHFDNGINRRVAALEMQAGRVDWELHGNEERRHGHQRREGDR
jgi:hypothetical protein